MCTVPAAVAVVVTVVVALVVGVVVPELAMAHVQSKRPAKRTWYGQAHVLISLIRNCCGTVLTSGTCAAETTSQADLV